MLRWQKTPTPTFQAFVHEALQAFLAETAPGWIADFPRLGQVFTEDQATQLIADLLAAHDRTDIYQLTDYHWLLLWEVLHAYYAWARPVPYPTFDRWVSPDWGHFWDTDFLMPEAAELGPKKRKMVGLSDEAFSIAGGLRPHPDELRITKCSRCPVCGLALLEAAGEPVPEHGRVTRKGQPLVCPGVGHAAVE